MSSNFAFFDDEAARKEWLERRRLGIGASESASILGLNPYKSAYALWAEKVGLVEPADLSENEAVEWGHVLEASIAEKYVRITGRQVARPGAFEMHKCAEHPFMQATLDRIILPSDVKPHGVLEIKTTGSHHADEWDGDAPTAHQCQFQHQLVVTGWTWGSLAVLIGGQKFRYLDLERNDCFCAFLVEREEEFWDRVQREDPPPVDASDSTKEALKRLYPSDSGEKIALPGEALEWSCRRAELKEQLKTLQEELQGIENQIKAAIGAATFGVLPDGSGFKYALQQRAGYTVQPAEIRVLREVKQVK
jgi:putative phage-type endonuclease